MWRVMIMAALVTGTVARAAENGPVKDPRLTTVRTLRQGSGFVPPGDKEVWQKRAQDLRAQVLIAAGLWPMPEKTPLNAVIHGRIEREDYTVERVFFESYPGFYVTGSLYRPKGKTGPFAGVLCPHGHWANGRFNETPEKEIDAQIKAGVEKDRVAAKYILQARCANLAKLGCVVFHYDMVGYADADEKHFPHHKTMTDAEADLNLQSIFGLQTWDSIRALDFLLSLADVDKERIACTGASGGGTQTFIMMTVDDRLKVAAPVCMISAGDHQGGCVCENNALLRIGTDNVELSATFAPRPFIHPTATGDWTKDYLEQGYPETLGVYRLFGVEENVKAVRFNAGHNYALGNREAMYNFFNTHLKLGAKEPVKERPFTPIAPKDLSVFTSDHPRPADSTDAPTLRKYLADQAAKQMQALKPTDAASLEKFRQVLQPALRHLLACAFPVEGASFGVQGKNVEKIMKIEIECECGLRKPCRLPALAFYSEQRLKGFHLTDGPVTILIHPSGKSAALSPDGSPTPLVSALLARGHMVIAPDFFLTGDLAGPNPIATSKIEFFAGYNRTVIANRAHDILACVTIAKDLGNSVNLVGVEGAGPWVMLARALAGDAVKRTVADGGGFEFGSVKERGDVNYLPGAVKYGGLYNLAALGAPGEMLIFNAGDSDTTPLTAAYAAAGASTKCRVEKGKVDVVEWLTR